GADATERCREASLAVDEAGIRFRHLGAEDARRVGVRARAADRDDPLVLDGDGEAAGVGTIEGADAGVLGSHLVSPVGASLIAGRTISVYTLSATGGRAIGLSANKANPPLRRRGQRRHEVREVLD